jgi:hypothetical protein
MLERLDSMARQFGAACALVLLGALFVLANQANTWSPTTGTVSGLQLVTNYNNAFSAVQSCNSGASAPANDQTLAAVKGQCWLDTSTTPNTVRMYDGASWLTLGWLDATNHVWIANSGGSTGTIASAATTDLGAVVNQVVSITGTTTIASFGSTAIAGSRYFINFTGVLTLTHNATSLILPNGGSNIITAAGDTAIAEHLGSGNWRVVAYQAASGAALVASANFTANVNFNGVISPAALASNTNNWNPAGLATANVIRFSCSPAITITGLTAPAADGQVIVLDNVGATNTCTLTAQDTNSTAANRFAFDRPIAIRPGRTLTIKYDLTTARWVLWQEVPSQLVAGGFKNLRLLNVANALGDTAPATPNNQMKIVLDEIAVEDANGGVVRIDLSYSYSCTVDLTTSGAGGLDTGSVAASTGYFYWVIFNASTNTASCLASTSSSSPTMPSGYTFKARVGWNVTDASANKCLYRVMQYGRVAHYGNTGANAGCSADNSLGPRLLANGAQGSTYSASNPQYATRSLAGLSAPTAARVEVFSLTTWQSGTCTGGPLIAPTSSYGGGGTGFGPAGANSLFIHSVGTTNSAWVDLDLQSVAYAVTGGGCAAAVGSWEDNF